MRYVKYALTEPETSVTEKIHDDVERALAAFGSQDFSYRTFGTFSIHSRTPIVIAPEPPAPEPPAVAEPMVAAPAAAELMVAQPAVAAPPTPARIEPAFGPRPDAAMGEASPDWARAPVMTPPPEPVPFPSAPPPHHAPPPAYAQAQDPYFGPVPGTVRGPVTQGPFGPEYAAPAPLRLPEARPAAPPPARPAPGRHAGEMNIFQLAWDSAAAAADGTERAGPRLAAKERPLPGEEDLFRRI